MDRGAIASVYESAMTMKAPAPKFRVMSSIYKTRRQSFFDGPWKSTLAEAVTAYKEKLAKKGLTSECVFSPYAAEMVPVGTGPAKGSDGKEYRDRDDLQGELERLLLEAGLKVAINGVPVQKAV